MDISRCLGGGVTPRPYDCFMRRPDARRVPLGPPPSFYVYHPVCSHPPIDSPCACEHNNPDSLDARLFFTVVLAVAPAVSMDEASSLSPLGCGRWYAPSPRHLRSLLSAGGGSSCGRWWWSCSCRVVCCVLCGVVLVLVVCLCV